MRRYDRPLSPAAERRIRELLAGLRTLEPKVEITRRVLRSVQSEKPGGAALPSERQIGWGVAAGALGCLAALLGACLELLRAPDGLAGPAAALAHSLRGLLGSVAHLFTTILASAGRAAVALVHSAAASAPAAPSPVGASATFAAVCLTLMLVTMAALILHDLRRPGEGRLRRSS